MSQEPKSLAQRAREAIGAAARLAEPESGFERMSASELEVFADTVERASSDLNGAAHRLRRLAKQKKKIGAAGAVHDTRK